MNVSGKNEGFWANAKRGLREREIADILRVIDKWRPYLDIPEDTPGILRLNELARHPLADYSDFQAREDAALVNAGC